MIPTTSGIDIQSVADAILGWTAHAVAFGTIVAGLTWLVIRLLGKRASPTLQVALWSLVLVKFLVPVGPGWSLSLASSYERLSMRASSLRVADADAETGPVFAPIATANEAVQADKMAAPLWFNWKAIAAGAYVLTVVGLGATRIRGYRLFRARCLAFPAPDESTRRVVCGVCRRLGVRRMPLIRISDEARAPFVTGFVRPLLVLSSRQLVRPNELETVIVHEVTHIRRGDMSVRCLQWVAGTVLFFWPVVAWVNRRIDGAREFACDQWALRHGKLTVCEYARCLLSVLRPLQVPRLVYQPACMAGSPSTMERRIDMILALSSRPARRPIWGLFTVAILVAWGGFTLTGAAVTNGGPAASEPKYLPTEKDMRLHADTVYARVNEYAAGDLNGDGQTTKDECWSFVTAVVLQQTDAVLEEYPDADRNSDGELDLLEAYQFVRGDYDLKAVQKYAQYELTSAKKSGDKERFKELKAEAFAREMEAWHFILDRRDRLMDMMSTEPNLEKVKKIAAKIAKFEDKKKSAALAGGPKLASAMADISELKAKAEDLRAQAATLSSEEAEGYYSKATQLEQKATTLSAKLTGALEENIARLEAAGKHDEAADLKAKLAKLQEL